LKLIELLAGCVQYRRKTTVAFLVVLTLVTGWGLVNGNARPTWGDAAKGRGASNVQRDDLDAFDLRGSDCFFVVEVDDLYNSETIAALRGMVDAVEQLEYIAEVNWLDRVPVTNVFGLAEPLLPPDGSSAEHYRDSRRRVGKHPLVAGQLISPDGKTLLMPVTFDWLYVANDSDCSSRLLKTAREALAADSTGGQHVKVRLTGAVPLFVDYQIAFDRGHRRYLIIGMLVSFGLAVAIFRSVFPVLISVGAPALGVFWTEGILHLIDEPANPIGNVVLPVLLIMVGLTDAVHLLMKIRRSRVAGADPGEAAAAGIRQTGMACLLTSVTTAIGFASLTLAQSELVQGFGRSCAIGVMTTFVAVVLVAPILSMTRLGNSLGGGSHNARWSVIDTPWLDGPWIDWIFKRRVRVALFGVLLLGSLAAVCGQLRPDETMSSYQPSSSEAFQSLHHVDKTFGGLEFIQVQVVWEEKDDDGRESNQPRESEGDEPNKGQPNGPVSPARIVAAIRDVESLIRAEPLLSDPLSLNDVLASLPGDGPIEDRMSLVEVMPKNLRRFLIRQEDRTALVSSRTQDLGIAAYQPVFARLNSKLNSIAAKHPGFSFELTGMPIRRGSELITIVMDLVASLGTASVVILAVMTVAFRSWRIGLVTILPNILPLAVTGAILWSMGHSLELASVCSFTVCLGIAVDDTIHFLTHYKQQTSSGMSVERSVRATIQSVGGSLVITTVILVAGFSTVLTSELPGQRLFAAMACATIGSALVGDLIFLPALLAIFGREEKTP